MSRGPMFAPGKLLADTQPKLGGSVPVAKIFLPQFSTALPIRLMSSGNASRRIAEARPRRTT